MMSKLKSDRDEGLKPFEGITTGAEIRASKVMLIDKLKEKYWNALEQGNFELALEMIIEQFDLFEGVRGGDARTHILKANIEKMIEVLVRKAVNRELTWRDLRLLNKWVNKYINSRFNYMAKKKYELMSADDLEAAAVAEMGLLAEAREIAKDSQYRIGPPSTIPDDDEGMTEEFDSQWPEYQDIVKGKVKRVRKKLPREEDKLEREVLSLSEIINMFSDIRPISQRQQEQSQVREQTSSEEQELPAIKKRKQKMTDEAAADDNEAPAANDDEANEEQQQEGDEWWQS